MPFGICALVLVSFQSSKLTFSQGSFTITTGKTKAIVSTSLPKQAPVTSSESVLIRKDKTFVAYDQSGFRIRRGDKVNPNAFPALTPNEKWLSESDKAAIHLFKETGKSLKPIVTAAKRIGNDTYWAIEWRDSVGATFFATVGYVNLAGEEMRVTPIAPVTGSICRFRPFASRFLVSDGFLYWIEADSFQWGAAKLNLKSRKVSRTLHEGIVGDLQPLSSRLFIVNEESPYGKAALSRFDLISGAKRKLVESAGPVRLVSQKPLICMMVEGGKTTLLNLDTGAKLMVPKQPSVRMTPAGMLVWTGGATPSVATLYQPTSWEVISAWKAPAKPNAKPAPKPTAKPPTKPKTKPKPTKP